MNKPFIRNHHYNFIKKQSGLLLNALRTVADRKIVDSVRSDTEAKIMDLFPDITDSQAQLLGAVTSLETADDFHKYLVSLEPYLTEFPRITKEQIQMLFPKNKKLKVPDLASIDYRFVTYLSWLDIAANKLFIVYPLNGQFVGVEGRYTPTNKKSYCFVCNKFEELALFSAVFKKRPPNASPDYYKSLGNYLCMNGHDCNKNATDVDALEKFIRTVLE